MWKSVLFFAVFCGCGSLAQNIKVSIYYETLCGDSIRFIVNQFYPVYQEYGTRLDVDWVPYGKANATNVSGSWEFECQHGEVECYGNKFHSCAVELYPVDQSTDFVYCAMNSGNASSEANLEACSISSNISWTTLEECVSSGQGDELLAANGKRTDELIPDLINFVPTIVINEVFNKQLHTLALNNFEATVLFFSEQIDCGFCHFTSASNTVLDSGKLILAAMVLIFLLQKLFA